MRSLQQTDPVSVNVQLLARTCGEAGADGIGKLGVNVSTSTIQKNRIKAATKGRQERRGVDCVFTF